MTFGTYKLVLTFGIYALGSDIWYVTRFKTKPQIPINDYSMGWTTEGSELDSGPYKQCLPKSAQTDCTAHTASYLEYVVPISGGDEFGK